MINFILACLAFPACTFSAANAIEAPSVKFATGYSNGKSEAHPHSGVELSNGGFFMTGDSLTSGESTAERSQFAVMTDSSGNEKWQVSLGDLGYNYGKFGLELGDGTLLILGSTSVSNSDTSTSTDSYSELRSIHRLDPQDGSVLSHTLFPNTGAGNDGFMGGCLVSSDEKGLTILATGYIGGEGKPEEEEAMFLIQGGHAFAMKISFSSAADGKVVWEKILDSGDDGFTMEQETDVNGDSILISTAGPEEGLLQWSALGLTSSGDVRWRRIYPGSDANAPADQTNGTMSHPYSLTSDGEGGAVIAGHAYPASDSILQPFGLPVGRMVRINSSGGVQWDARFKPSNAPADHNVECYGVALALDGGFVATCGFGCMPETCERLSSKENKIWQVHAHRVDKDGNQLWDKLYTDTSRGNNAGEYIVGLREGGYAIYVDATNWGSEETGGNFGLMVLESDV